MPGKDPMAQNSFEILEGRIRSAVEERQSLQAENARLRDRIEALRTREESLEKELRGAGVARQENRPAVDVDVVRGRLRDLLTRITRLENTLEKFDR